MTTYTLLIRQDESAWAAATESERAETYARHGRFAEALATRGHTITAGAELLASSRSAAPSITPPKPVPETAHHHSQIGSP